MLLDEIPATQRRTRLGRIMANEYVRVQKRKLLEQMEEDAKAKEDRGKPEADSVAPKPKAPRTTPNDHPGAGASDHVVPELPQVCVCGNGVHRSQFSARPKLKLHNFPQQTSNWANKTSHRDLLPLPYDEVLDMPEIAGVDCDDVTSGDADNDYDIVDIQLKFTSAELFYVQPILKKMEMFFSPMTWVRKTGEIMLEHKVVPNTNIVELLKDTLTGNLHPVGKMEFYRGLNMLDVKLCDIKNQKGQALLILSWLGQV